jgi:hypothetical protein
VLHSKREDAAQVTNHRPLYMKPGAMWALAACVSIVVLSVVFLIVSPRPVSGPLSTQQAVKKHISNNSAADMEVLLKDGSRVLLKPKSRIAFTEPFDSLQRLVALEGEAFFTVSRDTLHPFLVHTKEVVTKVLGTSFTVSAFANDDNITVSVMTGKVSVTTRKDKDELSSPLEETILTPNQKIIYNKNKKLVSRAIVKDPLPILPRDVVKRMQFEAAPIREIFEGLEEVYGVDIEFDEHTFASCILTTSIADGNIYNRLEMICKAIDAEYTVKENHIVISGAGCRP